VNHTAIWTILTKELGDVLSERVYWFAFTLELVIVLGVILLGIAFATMMNPIEMETAVPRLELNLGILSDGDGINGSHLVASLLEEDMRLSVVKSMDVLLNQIAGGDLMGGIELPKNYDECSEGRMMAELILDESKVYSSLVRSRVESAVDAANEDLSRGRLSGMGIEERGVLMLNTSSIGSSVLPISSPDFVEAMYLMVIPLVMIFPVLLSANMTSDSIVGEKENGTLGILIATPTSRLDVVLGKVIPVLALANLQFLAWIFLLENNILGSVRVFNKIPLLILLNLGAICFIGVSLLISVRARSTKESNLYLTLVIMVLVFPLFVGIPDIGLPSRILESVTLVKTIGYITASPRMPLDALLSPLIILGLVGAGVLTLCTRSVRNLEPPPSR